MLVILNLNRRVQQWVVVIKLRGSLASHHREYSNRLFRYLNGFRLVRVDSPQPNQEKEAKADEHEENTRREANLRCDALGTFCA